MVHCKKHTEFSYVLLSLDYFLLFTTLASCGDKALNYQIDRFMH